MVALALSRCFCPPSDASDAIKYAKFRAHPPRNYPKTTGPRRHDAANDARARSETTATTPLRRRLSPLRHPSKKTTQT